jgi:prepilin-type N-terminal cleavage/methylation domain-containing protein
MARARSPKGFTLIEVMVTAGIVGILMSIAIPNFQRLIYRAKISERTSTMLRIKKAVQDYYLRNGNAVPGGGNLDSGWNPAWPPTSVRRPMSTTLGNWNIYFTAPASGSSLPVEIEGAVYYSYRFIIQDTPTAGTITVYAAGDLDGDGVVSQKRFVFTRISGMYQLTSEFPLPGAEDDSGPYATF